MSRSQAIRRGRFVRVVALCLVQAGCTGEASDSNAGQATDTARLQVVAAASLRPVMPELLASFATASGTMAEEVVYGSTRNLATQIEYGAPADVFFAADEETVDRLVAGGHIRPTTRRTYAVGRIVIVSRTGMKMPTSLRELRDPTIEVIAIANPELAPYGRAARSALENSSLWDAVAPRIVYGEDVVQTYQLVQTGNADAAIVPLSLVLEGGAARDFVEVDRGLYPAVRQAAGVVASSVNPAAESFLEFVVGPEGQAILERNGFGSPGP
jgi:molybdate transport system substrate-binding protein